MIFEWPQLTWLSFRGWHSWQRAFALSLGACTQFSLLRYHLTCPQIGRKSVLLESYSPRSGNPPPTSGEAPASVCLQVQVLQALSSQRSLQTCDWPATLCHQLQEQNERLQATLSQDQRKAAAQAQRQIHALRTQLQEQARLIASQEEMVGVSLLIGVSLLPVGTWSHRPLPCEDLLRVSWTCWLQSH